MAGISCCALFQITPGMRAVLVEWMTGIHRHFRLFQDSLFLAVNIVDRFLTTTLISRKCFPLLGITALLVAAKQVRSVFTRLKWKQCVFGQ